MINRILIRIKVIQLLYSYLLIQQNFSIESPSATPTKEKRFAHELYMDMLMLMVRLAQSIAGRGDHHPLLENRLMKSLMNDEKIRNLTMKYKNMDFPYATLEPELAQRIKESAIYKNYIKSKSDDAATDANVWDDIFRQIILTDSRIEDVASQKEGFSPRGVDRMKEMMQTTFRNFLSSQVQMGDILKSLKDSLGKARELYFRLLMLPVELTDMRALEIDEAMHKYIVTDEDRNPNLRFVENELVERIRNNEVVKEYLKDHKISWIVENRELMQSLLKAIKESEIYKEYMEFPATNTAMDVEFWRNIYRNVIMDNVDFLEALEDKSIYWNDDLEIISSFVLKTFNRFAGDLEEGENPVMEMYKDEEDARFGKELFSYAVKNRAEYEDMINTSIANSDGWESDRLAFMDVVIMITALAEILHFPKIPTRVSINEYIEMAKSYSTPKSGQFVHGVLGNIVNTLTEQGKLNKFSE